MLPPLRLPQVPQAECIDLPIKGNSSHPRRNFGDAFFLKCCFFGLDLTNVVIYDIIIFYYGETFSPNNERDGESGMDGCGSRTGADPIPPDIYHLLL